MFSLPTSVTSFLADERGVIAVDFVVLTGGATAMGVATMAMMNGELGYIFEGAATDHQRRDARPSFAYAPYDPGNYDRYTAMLSTLSDHNLAIMSAWGNATRDTLDTADDEAASRFFEDFDAAITNAYSGRGQSRGTGDEYEQYDLDRVAGMLGFSQSTRPATAGG